MLRVVAPLLCVSALLAGTASAQDYPSKVIRINTASVGGGSDFNARLVAQGISGPLGQSVIVANVGSGVVPAQTTAKAPPDGYTLMVHSSSVWISQVFLKVPYDTLRDLAPISLLVGSPSILVVHPSLPVKSLKELIALAKAHPGQLNMGSGPNGTRTHIDGEFFKSMAGINVTRIPYSDNAMETTELLSGQLQVGFVTPGPMVASIKSGKLRALAVTSLKASALYPELPTVSATVPGFEAVSLYGMWAPAKTPDAIIRKLNQEAVRLMGRADTKEKLLTNGLEPIASSPEEFGNYIRNDLARLNKLVPK